MTLEVWAAELTDKTEAEITALFDDAAREGLKYGNSLIEQDGVTPIDPEGDWVRNTVTAMRTQTADSFRNLTGSLGFAERTGAGITFKPLARFYQDTLDTVLFQVQTGAADYRTAVRRAVDRMAASGLRTVDYASGWHNRIDVAARRAVMTGLSQLSGKLADETAHILGTTLIEITAHPGARPFHAVWQGRIVDKAGRDPRFLTLSDIGYGEGGGFKGWNCRHDWFPFVEGISELSFTPEELENIDPPPLAFEGKKYFTYEAAQQQRKIEAAILYAFGFGRWEAAKARNAAQKEVDKYVRYRYNKNGTLIVSDDWKTKGKVSIPYTYQLFAVIETQSSKGGAAQTDRTI